MHNFLTSVYAAPNAHYWLGQLLFNKQDWSAAGEQFTQRLVLNFYPDSSKRADAMFKLGVVEQNAIIWPEQKLFEQVLQIIRILRKKIGGNPVA